MLLHKLLLALILMHAYVAASRGALNQTIASEKCDECCKKNYHETRNEDYQACIARCINNWHTKGGFIDCDEIPIHKPEPKKSLFRSCFGCLQCSGC